MKHAVFLCLKKYSCTLREATHCRTFGSTTTTSTCRLKIPLAISAMSNATSSSISAAVAEIEYRDITSE